MMMMTSVIVVVFSLYYDWIINLLYLYDYNYCDRLRRRN